MGIEYFLNLIVVLNPFTLITLNWQKKRIVLDKNRLCNQ